MRRSAGMISIDEERLMGGGTYAGGGFTAAAE
jgi:hypothetical protein